MGKEYVVNSATLECSLGGAPSNLVVLPVHRVKLRGQNRGNIGDAIPFVNILPFGACKKSSPPPPCTPACSRWIGGKTDVLIDGDPALLDSDVIVCSAGGGTISISDSGQ